MHLSQEEQKKARAKALRLLEHMDRTEKGLAERLRQAEFSEEAVADAMSYVKSFGYLNDLRYAEVYIRGRVRTKSRQQIFQELIRKGVRKSDLSAAWELVSELEEPDEREMIQKEILRKYAPGESLDEKSMRRLQGFFARRGFHYEDVASVLSDLDIHVSYENREE